MAISKEKKTAILENIKNILDQSSSTVFIGFKGLSVNDTALMRNKLREAGVGYTVVKKTLFNRVLKEKGIEGELPELSGELAIGYHRGTSEKSSDVTLPAREIFSFQKKFKDMLWIQGGVFEGVFLDQNRMVEIASIPSRETLLGQLVMLINSPIQQIAGVLHEVAVKREVA